MAPSQSPSVWTVRPSRTGEQLAKVAAGALVFVAGWVLYVETDQLAWWLGLTLVSLWVAFRGTGLVLRRLERLGLFGRVSADGSALHIGRRAKVDLGERFVVDTRLHQDVLRHEFEMRDVTTPFGYGRHNRERRLQEQAVSVLSTSVRQGEVAHDLVADEVGRAPPPSYDLRGITWQRAAVETSPHRPVRLRPQDLIAVLRHLQAAPGFAVPPNATPAPPSGDPRRLVWPAWKVVVGSALIGLAGLGALVWAFERAQTAHAERAQVARAKARAEGARREEEARTLMGHRVAIPARHGIDIEGTVTDVALKESTVYEPTYRVEWRPELTVAVDALRDAEGRLLPADAEVGFRHDDDIVRVGRQLHVGMDEVQPLPEAGS